MSKSEREDINNQEYYYTLYTKRFPQIYSYFYNGIYVQKSCFKHFSIYN